MSDIRAEVEHQYAETVRQNGITLQRMAEDLARPQPAAPVLVLSPLAAGVLFLGGVLFGVAFAVLLHLGR